MMTHQGLTIAFVILLAVPTFAVPAHHTVKKNHHAAHILDEAARRHIFLLRSQTIYIAAAHFPGGSNDPNPQDQYQDHLLAGIDRRYSITEAQGQAIDAEGGAKMWPQMGLDGHIMHIH